MRISIAMAVCSLLFLQDLKGQSGSINNTLGSAGTFTVRNSSNDTLVVVDEATGQLIADRVKVEGVPSFFANHVEETGITSSPTILVIWDETGAGGEHDNSGAFDPSTGEFVVPRDGFYFFAAAIQVNAAGTSGAHIYIKRNSTFTRLQGGNNETPGSYASINMSGVLKLSAADVITVAVFLPGASSATVEGIGYFSGYLVSDF